MRTASVNMKVAAVNTWLSGRYPLVGSALAWALRRLMVYILAAFAGAAIVLVWAAAYTFVWPGTGGRMEIPSLVPHAPGMEEPVPRLDDMPVAAAPTDEVRKDKALPSSLRSP